MSDATPHPWSFVDLPEELVRKILEELCRLSPADAARVARLSHRHHRLSLPFLYTHLNISDSRQVELLRRTVTGGSAGKRLGARVRCLVILSNSYQAVGEGGMTQGELTDMGIAAREAASQEASSSTASSGPNVYVPHLAMHSALPPSPLSAAALLGVPPPSTRFTARVTADRILQFCPRATHLVTDRHFFYDANPGLFAMRRLRQLTLVGLGETEDFCGLLMRHRDQGQVHAERILARWIRRTSRQRARAMARGDQQEAEAFGARLDAARVDIMRRFAQREAELNLPLRRIEIAYSPASILCNLKMVRSLTHIVITYPNLPPDPPSPALPSLRVIPRSHVELLLGLQPPNHAPNVRPAAVLTPMGRRGHARGETTSGAIGTSHAPPPPPPLSEARSNWDSRLRRIIVRASASTCARIAEELMPIEDERLRFRVVGFKMQRRPDAAVAAAADPTSQGEEPSDGGENAAGGPPVPHDAESSPTWNRPMTITTTTTVAGHARTGRIVKGQDVDFAVSCRRGFEAYQERRRAAARARRARRGSSSRQSRRSRRPAQAADDDDDGEGGEGGRAAAQTSPWTWAMAAGAAAAGPGSEERGGFAERGQVGRRTRARGDGGDAWCADSDVEADATGSATDTDTDMDTDEGADAPGDEARDIGLWRGAFGRVDAEALEAPWADEEGDLAGATARSVSALHALAEEERRIWRLLWRGEEMDDRGGHGGGGGAVDDDAVTAVEGSVARSGSASAMAQWRGFY